MPALDGRIGRIRLKSNGAELQLLPSGESRHSRGQFEKLDRAIAYIRHHYADRLDGFAIVAWRKDGAWSVDHAAGTLLHSLTLPEFVAGAIRHDYTEQLIKDWLNDILGGSV